MKFRPIAEPKSRDSIRSATAQNRGSGRGASWLDGPSAAFLYKVKSRALQRAGGYSLSTVVRNRPASSVPIELPLGSSERYISYIYIFIYLYMLSKLSLHTSLYFPLENSVRLTSLGRGARRNAEPCCFTKAQLIFQDTWDGWWMTDGWYRITKRLQKSIVFWEDTMFLESLFTMNLPERFGAIRPMHLLRKRGILMLFLHLHLCLHLQLQHLLLYNVIFVDVSPAACITPGRRLQQRFLGRRHWNIHSPINFTHTTT